MFTFIYSSRLWTVISTLTKYLIIHCRFTIKSYPFLSVNTIPAHVLLTQNFLNMKIYNILLKFIYVSFFWLFGKIHIIWIVFLCYKFYLYAFSSVHAVWSAFPNISCSRQWWWSVWRWRLWLQDRCRLLDQPLGSSSDSERARSNQKHSTAGSGIYLQHCRLPQNLYNIVLHSILEEFMKYMKSKLTFM